MTRWEYVTAQFITHGLGNESEASGMEAAMNQLGSEGWELASSTIYHNVEAEQDVLLLVFRRALPERSAGVMVEAAEPAPDVTTA